ARRETQTGLRVALRSYRHDLLRPRSGAAVRHVAGQHRATGSDHHHHRRDLELHLHLAVRALGESPDLAHAHGETAHRPCRWVSTDVDRVSDSADRVVDEHQSGAGVSAGSGTDHFHPVLHVCLQLAVRPRLRLARVGLAGFSGSSI
ncbi:FIG00962723: hypothetical protein, partial [Pseudomonas fluorescens]